MPKTTWGGYRPGSGRRPKGGVSGVSHHTRAEISSRQPVQVILATKPELGSLRRPRVHDAIRASLVDGCDAGSFRICHYSVQRHELRFVIEAEDREALSRGMQGVSVRIAKALNRLWERNGAVFADRYAARVLTTGQEVRRSLCFVLNGARRDEPEARRLAGRPDPFSSAAFFDGWSHAAAPAEQEPGIVPVARPRTAMLQRGWRRHGLLDVDERPAS